MCTTTILSVNNEPANLSMLTHMLRPLYQILNANSGENALRPVATAPQPDLVLLDVMRAIANQYKDQVNPER